jgi:4-hydroxybenzoate polyprenyltransferase
MNRPAFNPELTASPADLGSNARGALRAWMELVRLPNLPTAAADIMAGWAIAESSEPRTLFLLCASSVALYGGGIAMNDVADAAVDAVERPERPIPSGRIRRSHAALLASSMLLLGVVLAAQVSVASAMVALAIVAAVLSYDLLTKQFVVAPLNMGMCRGLNLALGISAAPAALGSKWTLCLIALVYITAVTFISRDEVWGGRRTAAQIGVAIVFGVASLLTGLALAHSAMAGIVGGVAFAVAVLPSWWRAARSPEASKARSGVRAGVLGIVLVDAALAGIYGSAALAAMTGALYLLAVVLSRRFWVT